MQDNEFLKITIITPTVEEYQQDLLICELVEMGFEGFEETSRGIVAYVLKSIFSEDRLTEALPEGTRYRVEAITSK